MEKEMRYNLKIKITRTGIGLLSHVERVAGNKSYRKKDTNENGGELKADIKN